MAVSNVFAMILSTHFNVIYKKTVSGLMNFATKLDALFIKIKLHAKIRCFNVFGMGLNAKTLNALM